MLESRSVYGWYGFGSATGEVNPFDGYARKTMHYGRYKKYYSKYKGIDYNPDTKEITVLIPTEEYKEYSNEGNHYQIWEYCIAFTRKSNGNDFVCWFKAKNLENALKQARKYAKDYDLILKGEAKK